MNRPASICAVAMSSVLLGACGGSGKGESAGAPPPTSSTSTTPTGVATTPRGEASSTEPAPGVVRAVSGGAAATMHASAHHPHVGAHWPISFLVTTAGKPTTAKVEYEYLVGGQVVAHRSHYTFKGTFHDIFTWPSSALGYPLTFRAVVRAGGATLNLDYPVQVVR